MPSPLQERGFVLRTLKAYTTVSVLALSACVYFATETVKDPDWVGHDEQVKKNDTNRTSADSLSWGQYVYQIFSVMIREPVSVWTMINMAFCWMIILSKFVQQFVFGELRVIEQQHLKDKCWNFIFYKFIFVFGIVNVQYVDEVLLWCCWFSLLGFLIFFSQLGKDRFEYLSFSPTTPVWNHVKLMGLLGCILAFCSFMFLVCAFIGFFVGFNMFAFMAADVFLLFLNTLHTVIRYSVRLYEMRQDPPEVTATDAVQAWEKRGPVMYYVELCFELSGLFVDFVHHCHMLFWTNILLSMASLVIGMQLRHLFYEFQERLKRHKTYILVKNYVEQNYPMASPEELSDISDNCAICWERLNSARKLPCNHLFHNACLQSWLEQHTSCPTCRMTLEIQIENANTPQPLPPDNFQRIRRQLNFFHFDGSRYVSWLPSFSVEVTQSLRTEDQNSQLNANARQVQQLFPHIPLLRIVEDLRITRSMEQTIDNILSRRLRFSPIFTPEVDLPPTTNEAETWEDVSSENIDTEENVSLAGRFSKSSEERERLLNKRKEQMRQMARKRYLEKQKLTSNAEERTHAQS